jgi:hypothetical protein
MTKRMDFNYIDFNRDQNINKEEFEFWLEHPVNLTSTVTNQPKTVSMIGLMDSENSLIK